MIINDLNDPEPTLTRPISQACTATQFLEPAYAYWCEKIKEPPRTHRKQWEFCYILQVLATAGMLAPGRRGLGFGVGVEPLASLLTEAGAEVLATDLAPEEASRTGWVDTNQHAHNKEALNERGLCPPDRFNELVSFTFADMNSIPTDIGDFDFTWSACAFEHLGSIELGKQFVLSTVDYLRPGGIAVHTTELNCSSDNDTLDLSSTVLFRRQDFLAMADAARARGCTVELSFNLGNEQLDQYIDVPPYSQDQHLKLAIQQWVTTSFGIVIHKR